MHSCPECDAACYCDCEDSDVGFSDEDCVHECDSDGESDEE